MGHGFHGYVSHNQRPWRFEVRDARLNVPAAIGRKFRIGDVVQDRGWNSPKGKNMGHLPAMFDYRKVCQNWHWYHCSSRKSQGFMPLLQLHLGRLHLAEVLKRLGKGTKTYRIVLHIDALRTQSCLILHEWTLRRIQQILNCHFPDLRCPSHMFMYNLHNVRYPCKYMYASHFIRIDTSYHWTCLPE